MSNERYQWIKGDDLGSVEVKTDYIEPFLVFESGRRCSDKVINEFMIPILVDEDILPLKNIETAVKALPKKKPRKPAPPSSQKKSKGPKGGIEVSSPIIPLLDKAKKTDTKLNIRLSLKLPSKEFLSVLQDSWDEDVLDLLSKHLYNEIKNPKEFLTSKIKASLSEWFHKK